MSDPFPAHHDDHHGRLAGRDPDRAGIRSGRRSPQTAGTGRRWRLDAFPIGDVVSDPGGLYVYGVLAREAARPRNGRTGTRTRVFALAGRIRLHELLGNI